MGRGQSLKLPDDFTATLRGMYEPGRRTAVSLRLCAVVALAYSKGWSFASIARALRVSREQARRLAKMAPAQITIPVHVPDAPAKRRRSKGVKVHG